MYVVDNLLYTNDHEWIRVEGNIGFIGITDYAQSNLGDIVFVNIDADLKEVFKGQPFGTIEAVKTVADLFSPVTGKVLEINPHIIAAAEVLNHDPYGEGWILKVEINDTNELRDLMDAESYKELIGE